MNWIKTNSNENIVLGVEGKVGQVCYVWKRDWLLVSSRSIFVKSSAFDLVS